MPLDLDTPRGRESLKHNAAALRIFKKHYPEVDVAEFPINRLYFDAVMLESDKVTGIVEIKARGATLEKLRRWGTWWIERKKLNLCADFARESNTPFWGFCYLTQDKVLLTKKLYIPAKGWTCRIRNSYENTQTSCNNTKLRRRYVGNIPMHDAEVLQ